MIRLALVLSLLASPAWAAWVVTDGDTIKWCVRGECGERIRIMGLDTPEKGGLAECLAERLLADQATMFAQGLVKRIERIERHGEERPWQKNRKPRTLARIYLKGGGSWAEAMIAAGLAEPYECPKGKCPRMTEWC